MLLINNFLCRNVKHIVHGAEGREVHILYEKDCLTSDNESLTPLHDMMTSIAH